MNIQWPTDQLLCPQALTLLIMPFFWKKRGYDYIALHLSIRLWVCPSVDFFWFPLSNFNKSFSNEMKLQLCYCDHLHVRRASFVGVNFFSVYTLAATVLIQSSSNLLRMFILMMSRSSSIMGGVGSKSRSLGQIKVKSCLHSRGHIFSPIFLKLAQNVCLDNIWVKFEHGWGGVKK